MVSSVSLCFIRINNKTFIYKLVRGRHNDAVEANADIKLLKFINMMKAGEFSCVNLKQR